MSNSISRTAPLVALVFSFGCSTSDAGLFSRAGSASAPVDGIGNWDGGDSNTGGVTASGGGSAVLTDGAGGDPFETQTGPDAPANVNGGTADGGVRVTSTLDAGLSDATNGVADARVANGGATETDATVPGSGGTCTATVWYPDSDGDRYGRSTASVSACSAPTVGNWVQVGGDCDDDDALVNPGQTRYFGTSFTGADGQPSYDYDCSGDEAGDPQQADAPLCGALSVLGCTGVGYMPTARVGAGQNPMCGSATLATCEPSGLFCTAVTSTTTAPYTCR